MSEKSKNFKYNPYDYITSNGYVVTGNATEDNVWVHHTYSYNGTGYKTYRNGVLKFQGLTSLSGIQKCEINIFL